MNVGNKKHTQHAPSRKTECDYLNGWIKKRSHTQKSHPKVVNPRDIAGEHTHTHTKKIIVDKNYEDDEKTENGWTGGDDDDGGDGGDGTNASLFQ